jgi:hypothetical protein
MTPKIGSTVFYPEANNQLRKVVGDPWEAYRLEEGEFLLESYQGYMTIGRLTGRTRQIFGIACPTIERFEVETYADDKGVILGRRGDKIPGTLAVRPETMA